MDQAPAAQHPGWSRKMILWSTALAAVLLLGAWGTANWKAFHLAYCKHLMKSSDPSDQSKGVELVLKVHLSRAMSTADVRKALYPAEFEMKTDTLGWTDHPGAEWHRYRGWHIEFDESGHYVGHCRAPLGP